VADSSNHRIQKLDSDGALLARWGSYGDEDGQFEYPRGVGVDPMGHVFVSGSATDRVQKFGGPWLDFFVGAPDPTGARQ